MLDSLAAQAARSWWVTRKRPQIKGSQDFSGTSVVNIGKPSRNQRNLSIKTYSPSLLVRRGTFRSAPLGAAEPKKADT